MYGAQRLRVTLMVIAVPSLDIVAPYAPMELVVAVAIVLPFWVNVTNWLGIGPHGPPRVPVIVYDANAITTFTV